MEYSKKALSILTFWMVPLLTIPFPKAQTKQLSFFEGNVEKTKNRRIEFVKHK